MLFFGHPTGKDNLDDDWMEDVNMEGPKVEEMEHKDRMVNAPLEEPYVQDLFIIG